MTIKFLLLFALSGLINRDIATSESAFTVYNYHYNGNGELEFEQLIFYNQYYEVIDYRMAQSIKYLVVSQNRITFWDVDKFREIKGPLIYSHSQVNDPEVEERNILPQTLRQKLKE